jgi:RNA polymerase sigma-70 factor, ECF subfamily
VHPAGTLIRSIEWDTFAHRPLMEHPPEPDTELDQQLLTLLRRCAASDTAALEQLYRLVAPQLLGCLMRMLPRRSLAEEVLQDVFVTVWRRADRFRPERGRPMAWLTSIARYRAIDVLRHERAAPTLVADLPEQATSEEREEESSAWLAGAGLLERCLKLLTQEQRRCLELAFVGGNSHGEIARLIDTPLGTVKSWIRRGLSTLRACLES